MANIKDELWEKGVSTADEYVIRRDFYGYIDKSNPDDSILSEVHLDPEYEIITSKTSFTIDNLGWTEYYDKEMRDYLEKGLDGIKI